MKQFTQFSIMWSATIKRRRNRPLHHRKNLVFLPHRGLAKERSRRDISCSEFVVFCYRIVRSNVADNLGALAPDDMLDRVPKLTGLQQRRVAFGLSRDRLGLKPRPIIAIRANCRLGLFLDHAARLLDAYLSRHLQVRLDGEKMRREAAKAAELQRHALPLPQPSISRIRSHTSSRSAKANPKASLRGNGWDCCRRASNNSRVSPSIVSCDSPTRRKAAASILPAAIPARTNSFSCSRAARVSGVEKDCDDFISPVPRRARP